MGLLREQVAVEERDLEKRNLQAAQHRLHFRRQVAVLHDELEQHADQIDRVLVRAGDMRLAVGLELAGLFEQFLLDLLHDVCGIGGRRRMRLRQHRLILQDGQRRQQVGRRQSSVPPRPSLGRYRQPALDRLTLVRRLASSERTVL